MPYVVCINKASPCCLFPVVVPAAPLCLRSLEVYGCTPDLTAGEKNANCCQGTTSSTGCCCLWTVPAGVTQISVELWAGGGGGGSGSADNCCGSNPGGGGSGWVKRTFPVSPGNQVTICAGAGGCGGGGAIDQGSWCCCGQQGSCSYVLLNGNFCADTHGGRQGVSICHWHCGCIATACGSCFGPSNDPTGDWGCNQGCTGYMNNPSGLSDFSMRAGPTSSVVPGCTGNCDSQKSYSGGAPFGGDGRWWQYSCNCWSYLRWNPSCTNNLGIAGPGGGSCSASTGFNIGDQYTCSTSGFEGCIRHNAAPPGNFPGGGGAGGHSSSCCNRKISGGIGAAGYVRVLF